MSSIIEDLPPGRLPPRHASPRIKIEFTDEKGARYSFSVEGPSKENMSKILDFVNSISNTSSSSSNSSVEPEPIPDTNFSRLFGLVQNKFRFGSFTSSDVLEAYEQHFQLRTTLSTMSTYLARLADRGVVIRSRNGAGWIYRLAREQKNEETPLTPQAESLPSTTIIEK